MRRMTGSGFALWHGACNARQPRPHCEDQPHGTSSCRGGRIPRCHSIDSRVRCLEAASYDNWSLHMVRPASRGCWQARPHARRHVHPASYTKMLAVFHQHACEPHRKSSWGAMMDDSLASAAGLAAVSSRGTRQSVYLDLQDAPTPINRSQSSGKSSLLHAVLHWARLCDSLVPAVADYKHHGSTSPGLGD